MTQHIEHPKDFSKEEIDRMVLIAEWNAIWAEAVWKSVVKFEESVENEP